MWEDRRRAIDGIRGANMGMRIDWRLTPGKPSHLRVEIHAGYTKGIARPVIILYLSSTGAHSGGCW